MPPPSCSLLARPDRLSSCGRCGTEANCLAMEGCTMAPSDTPIERQLTAQDTNMKLPNKRSWGKDPATQEISYAQGRPAAGIS